MYELNDFCKFLLSKNYKLDEENDLSDIINYPRVKNFYLNDTINLDIIDDNNQLSYSFISNIYNFKLYDLITNIFNKDFNKVINLFNTSNIDPQSIFYAISKNNENSINFLLDKVPDNIEQMILTDNGYENTGINLLIHSSYYLKNNDLYIKILNKNNDINKLTKKSTEYMIGNENAAHYASWSRDLIKLQILLDNGINTLELDAQGYTPLMSLYTIYIKENDKGDLANLNNFLLKNSNLVNNELKFLNNEKNLNLLMLPEFVNYLKIISDKIKLSKYIPENNINDIKSINKL